MGLFLAAWVTATAAYLLFAGQLAADEFAASVIAGAFAALWTVMLARDAEVALSVRRGGGGAVIRALAGLPLAFGRVAAALARAIASGRGGKLHVQPFDTGSQNDASEVGRRAVAILCASLAPDGYVVRVDKEAHTLRSHSIVEPATPMQTRWGR